MNIITVLLFHYFLFLYKERGLRGGKPRQMDSPLFKYFFAKVSLSDANDAPFQLNGTLGGLISISLKGLTLGNESPPFMWGGL